MTSASVPATAVYDELPWWLGLVQGVALLVLGALCLSAPGATIVVLVQLTGLSGRSRRGSTDRDRPMGILQRSNTERGQAVPHLIEGDEQARDRRADRNQLGLAEADG